MNYIGIMCTRAGTVLSFTASQTDNPNEALHTLFRHTSEAAMGCSNQHR